MDLLPSRTQDYVDADIDKDQKSGLKVIPIIAIKKLRILAASKNSETEKIKIP